MGAYAAMIRGLGHRQYNHTIVIELLL